MIVFRFPYTPTDEWEQILLRYDLDAHLPETASRGLVATGSPEYIGVEYRETPLEGALQAEIETLRRDWCRQRQASVPDPADGPVFEVGVACYDLAAFPGAIPPRTYVFRPDEVPAPLVALLEITSSPNCDDPYCGWREELSRE